MDPAYVFRCHITEWKIEPPKIHVHLRRQSGQTRFVSLALTDLP